MEQKYLTNSAAQTKKLGADLAKKILAQGPGEQAMVITLHGELGAGKTQFTQGLAKGLKVKENISSPTFVIMKKYGITDKGFEMFYHIDCYRLGQEEGLGALGIEEILDDPANIVAIEWPEAVKDTLPKKIIEARFTQTGKNERVVILRDSGFMPLR